MNYSYEFFQELNCWYIIPFPDFNLPSTFIAWTLRYKFWGATILSLDKILSSQHSANYFISYIKLSSAAWISGNEQNLEIAYTLIFSLMEIFPIVFVTLWKNNIQKIENFNIGTTGKLFSFHLYLLGALCISYVWWLLVLITDLFIMLSACSTNNSLFAYCLPTQSVFQLISRSKP